MILLGWMAPWGRWSFPSGLATPHLLAGMSIGTRPVVLSHRWGLLAPYSFSDAAARASNEAQLQQFLPSPVENRMPDLAGWFVPHLLLTGLSLLLVLIAALAFKRSATSAQLKSVVCRWAHCFEKNEP